MLSQQAIERATAVLMRGEAVILPTDTVPGLFMLDSKTNKEKLCQIKKRNNSKPFARMFADRRQLEQFVLLDNPMSKTAVEKLLPGKVTLILPARSKKDQMMGIRVPADSSLRSLIRRTGPLIATSANISGKALLDPARLPGELLRNVALVEEDISKRSYLPELRPSTVIDFTLQRPTIKRKGALSIWEASKRLGSTPYLSIPQTVNLLFVCGGNTCRSPMSATIFSNRCRLDRIQVRSAGLSAVSGAPAAMFAIQVMRDRGLSLKHHHSTGLSSELMRWADLVLVMTRDHLARIRRIYKDATGFVFILGGFPASWPHGRGIDDPIGSTLEVYRETAVVIERFTKIVCEEITKVLTGAD
ncbi:Sua5/YciO/YrdC/YwlC family protein [candidate division WOR-3 bacterium]|nr:Sua5/YciO/YrdC/YwlC family protein [candidate division WOR-3 bacterium]